MENLEDCDKRYCDIMVLIERMMERLIGRPVTDAMPRL